jgi:hypothetical protein
MTCDKCGFDNVVVSLKPGTPIYYQVCQKCLHVVAGIADFIHPRDESGDRMFVVYALLSTELNLSECSRRFRSVLPSLRDLRVEEFLAELRQNGRFKIGVMYNADIQSLRRKLDDLGLKVSTEDLADNETAPLIRFLG